jgi:hypothetical protein
MANWKDNHYKLIARAWEIVTCANNHPCYIVLRDVYSGAPIRKEDFTEIGGAPKLITQTPISYRCPVCEMYIFDMSGFHIRGELRGQRGIYLTDRIFSPPKEAESDGKAKDDVQRVPD